MNFCSVDEFWGHETLATHHNRIIKRVNKIEDEFWGDKTLATHYNRIIKIVYKIEANK